MNIYEDNRTVLTLDAGGTNMVFGAMKGGKPTSFSVTLPSNADNLDKCLNTMVEGFNRVIETLSEKPLAISFAFPGPADYPNGIIGGFLPNFPSFRDGVALGPFLQNKFGIPVFINNDGDLYAYGEALGGVLPEVNAKIAAQGGKKHYKNLIGYTFGTGLGIGCVIGGKLNIGDNSCVETFCLPHPDNRDVIIEDGAAIRAVKRVYGELSGDLHHGLEPKDIAAIAHGEKEGNQEAAIKAFEKMGEVAGEAIRVAVTLMDGLVVIGGGIMGSHDLLMPSILNTLRGKIHTMSGDELDRVLMKVYNLDDDAEFEAFVKGEAREIKIYGSEETVVYDPQKRIGIMRSKIGASAAISLGAYAFALSKLDELSNN